LQPQLPLDALVLAHQQGLALYGSHRKDEERLLDEDTRRRARSTELWAALRRKVVKGSIFEQMMRTLRAIHSMSLLYINYFDGFSAPPLAVSAVVQHMLKSHAAPFWLDAHCLAEDEARQLQRTLGFHQQTFSLLYNSSHDSTTKYPREVFSD